MKVPFPVRELHATRFEEGASLSLFSASTSSQDPTVRSIEKALASHHGWVERYHRSLIFGGVASRAPRGCHFAIWFPERGGVDSEPQPGQGLLDLHDHVHELSEALLVRAAPAMRESAYSDFYEAERMFLDKASALVGELRCAQLLFDPVTHVLDRRTMETTLVREQHRMQREDRPSVVALADLDHFKSINDSFGHLAGDDVLAQSAASFVGALRPYDMLFRYGGDEFLFCFPNTDTREAVSILSRLGDKLQNLVFKVGTVPIRLTASFGAAAMRPEETIQQTLTRADGALYEAKASGRDCVRLAGEKGAL